MISLPGTQPHPRQHAAAAANRLRKAASLSCVDWFARCARQPRRRTGAARPSRQVANHASNALTGYRAGAAPSRRTAFPRRPAAARTLAGRPPLRAVQTRSVAVHRFTGLPFRPPARPLLRRALRLDRRLPRARGPDDGHPTAVLRRAPRLGVEALTLLLFDRPHRQVLTRRAAVRLGAGPGDGHAPRFRSSLVAALALPVLLRPRGTGHFDRAQRDPRAALVLGDSGSVSGITTEQCTDH